MRKKWGNRIGAIVLACALTMSGLPVQSISTSTRKDYEDAKSEIRRLRFQTAGGSFITFLTENPEFTRG